MLHLRTLVITLVLVSLALVPLGSAAAAQGQGQPKARQPKARITWTVPSAPAPGQPARVEVAVTPGQPVAPIEVTLTSSTDVANVTLVPSGGLARVVTVEPSSIASLKAGQLVTVRLTVAMPADGAHSQGGVIKVRAGKRSLPASLKVQLTVPGAPDDDAARP
ncbi:MAG: hypothetical protein RLZZ387_97 [Chloroflexota bacterium]